MRSLKTYIKLAYYFSPKWLQQRLSERKEKKELELARERSRRTTIEKDELKRIVDSLPLGDCDVMLHSSMMNIGKVKGGVKWVAQCLMEKIDTENHTLLVSALPYRGRFKDYLETNPIFDVRTAPVAMGAINEYFALLPDAVRSVHPTHSIVAIGKNAKEYVAGHHLDSTPFGVLSPYYKLVKNKGKIMMLGASLNYLTSVHVIEDLLGDDFPVSVYDKKTYKTECVDKEGNHLTVTTMCHNGLKGALRDAGRLYEGLVSNGIMDITKIGESEIFVIDACGFARYYLRCIAEGETIYGKCRITRKARQHIETLIDSL